MKPSIKKYWTEEDIRALIREELSSATHLELMNRAARAAHGEYLASIAPTLEAHTSPRRWWRFLRGK